MYYAYMLRSESTKRHYYGYTSDIEKRINSHNSTQNIYTRGKGPWKLVGYKECESKSEAIQIEQKLKGEKNSWQVSICLNKKSILRINVSWIISYNNKNKVQINSSVFLM